MSAPAYTDQTLDNVWSDSYGVYTVDYAAATQGENLIVQYRSLGLYDADYGNVTLQSATLTGNLNPNEPPTVRITAPTNNAVFYAGTNILIQAEAMDSDGSVTKVEFLKSGTKIGEDASSPYSMVWSNVAAGSYTLTARATDNGSAINTSSLVQIDVVNPPLLEVKIQNARWQVGVFKFDVVTQSGRSYTVQYTAGLKPVDWQTFSTFQGDGSMKTITDSQPHVRRFYQLKVQ
jgi:hypothetical protein